MEKVNLQISDEQKLERVKPFLIFNKDGSFTSDFLEWNEGNKLTDECKPLRWFHGTTKNFNFFHSSKIEEVGFHFGTSEQANDFVWVPDMIKVTDIVSDQKPKVIPVSVCMKNPLEMTEPKSWDFVDKTLEVGNHFDDDYPFITELTNALKGIEIEGKKYNNKKELRSCIIKRCKTNEDVRKFLIELGYDGITYMNTSGQSDRDKHSVIAFHPWQVRSFFTGEYIWKND